MTIQQLILDLLPIIVPYVLAHSFVIAARIYHGLTQRLPANQRAVLEYIASKAVAMAEQKYKSFNGTQKRMYAEAALYALCQYFGIPTPDRAVVDALIEAAVSEINRELGTTDTTLPNTKS